MQHIRHKAQAHCTVVGATAPNTTKEASEGMPAKAYSYLRFSTPDQMKGDSQRRQLEAAKGYAREHGLELDEALTFQDLGVSAYKGANATVGALRAFRRAVEDRRIEPGSYLLVEDFDRLSRMSPWDAQAIFQEIINAGINIVTLKDKQIWTREALISDPSRMMMSVFAMWNGHQESVKKSGRVFAAWEAKRRRLGSRSGPTEKPYTRTCPAWLTWSPDAKAFVEVPERAEIVRQIFAKADTGAGAGGIARWLNSENVPTWANSKRKAAFWHTSYVRKILTNKATIGTFTPHLTRTEEETKARYNEPLDPVPDYYPAVVDAEMFDRVFSRMQTAAPRGRNAGRTPTSLVAGVAKCARCGGAMLRVNKGKPPKVRYTYLVCARAHARAKGCEHLPVRYECVEEALRVNARAIVEDAPRGADTTELEQEIAAQDYATSELKAEQEFLVRELVKNKSNALRRALREKEAELAAASRELRRMRERRDATANAYVVTRLAALQRALEQNPFSVAAANNTLRQAVRAITIEPTGSLAIHWHHSEVVTEGVPFYSKHSAFNAGEEDNADKYH